MLWVLAHGIGEAIVWLLGLLAAGALAGKMTGVWPLSIAADALPMILAALALSLLLLLPPSIPAQMAGWMGLAGLAAAALWSAPPPAPGEGKSERVVRLAQANVEGKGLGSVHGGEDFDIGVFCELRGVPGKSAAFPASWRGLPLLASSEEAGIYAKGELRESGLLGKGLAPWHQGLWAEIELEGGGRALVVSVHANAPRDALRQESRDAFFLELERFLDEKEEEGLPIILAGDINATPFGKAAGRLLGREGLSAEPSPISPTWPAKWARYGAGFRIDRTLGLSGARVISWSRLPMGDSDHLFSRSQIALPQ